MNFERDLRGVTPPLVAPFTGGSDSDVDHDALAAVVDHAVEGGVAGLFPNGTTGEFASLTTDERAAVVETTVDAAPEVPVLAGVTDTAVADVLAHADRAAAAGADAVVVTPPSFHGPNDDAGLARFFERVADGSPLPVFLYDIPSCTGTPIPAELVVELAEHPNVVGLKDSSGDFGGFTRLLRETPEEFLLLQGFDNLLWPSLRLGADGGVNALANVVPGALSELAAAALDADGPTSERGAEIHETVSPLFEACLDLGFAPAAKAGLVARDVIDDPAVRPPLSTVEVGAVEGAVNRVLEE